MIKWERLVRLFCSVNMEWKWNWFGIFSRNCGLVSKRCLLGSRILSKPLKFNWKSNLTNESSENGHWRHTLHFESFIFALPPPLLHWSFSFTIHINFKCNDVYRPVLIIYLYVVFSLFWFMKHFFICVCKKKSEKTLCPQKKEWKKLHLCFQVTYLITKNSFSFWIYTNGYPSLIFIMKVRPFFLHFNKRFVNFPPSSSHHRRRHFISWLFGFCWWNCFPLWYLSCHWFDLNICT